jgi:hypothetical protein
MSSDLDLRLRGRLRRFWTATLAASVLATAESVVVPVANASAAGAP